MIRYRTESFSGLMERDAAEVMAFETFEMCNADILETLRNGVLKGNPICDQFQRMIDCLDGTSEEDFLMGYNEGIEFFQNIINEIRKVTGHDIKYVLWLADKETVMDSSEGYGSYVESDEDIDAYEVGPVVLSELGYDGSLYGYEEYPEPIKNLDIIIEDINNSKEEQESRKEKVELKEKER